MNYWSMDKTLESHRRYAKRGDKRAPKGRTQRKVETQEERFKRRMERDRRFWEEMDE